MQQFFRELAKVYKDYTILEQKLNDNYDMEKGTRNRDYLRKLSADNQNKLKAERENISNRISRIRNDFVDELNRKYDIESSFISTKLTTVLNSGFNFNEREWTQLAEKHKNNIVESRLIRDSAARQGFTITNYVSYDECLLNFDNLARHIKDDMAATDPIIKNYLTVQDCEMACGQYCAKCSVQSIECYPTPATPVEALSRDIAKDKAAHDKMTEEQGKAFIEGLTGEKATAPIPAEYLTSEEQLRAKISKKLDGDNSDINEDDVAAIRQDLHNSL
jgi:hypothetical protein